MQPLLGKPGESYRQMVKRFKGLTGHERDYSWYNALREYQGELAAWIETKIPVWPHSQGLGTQFDIEWGYLINCDDEALEVYTGHYRRAKSRSYARLPLKGRYICLLYTSRCV